MSQNGEVYQLVHQTRQHSNMTPSAGEVRFTGSGQELNAYLLEQRATVPFLGAWVGRQGTETDDMYVVRRSTGNGWTEVPFRASADGKFETPPVPEPVVPPSDEAGSAASSETVATAT